MALKFDATRSTLLHLPDITTLGTDRDLQASTFDNLSVKPSFWWLIDTFYSITIICTQFRIQGHDIFRYKSDGY
jgi:hypothetical protein